MAPEDNSAEGAALGLLAAQQRKEAMDSALDIISTTSKLELKQAMSDADKRANKAETAFTEARNEYSERRRELAQEALLEHPAVDLMVSTITAMSNGLVVPDPMEIFDSGGHSGALDLSFYDNDGVTMVRCGTCLHFQTSRVEAGAEDGEYGHTKLFAGDIKIRFDVADEPELVELQAKIDESDAELKAARKVQQAVRDRQRALPDQEDAARVNLQRNNLTNIGGDASVVLQKVDEMLAAGKEGNYLALL